MPGRADSCSLVAEFRSTKSLAASVFAAWVAAGLFSGALALLCAIAEA